MANKTKPHTLKMKLATIDIKLIDVTHRMERLAAQRVALIDLQRAVQKQLDMLEAEQTPAETPVQEPA